MKNICVLSVNYKLIAIFFVSFEKVCTIAS